MTKKSSELDPLAHEAVEHQARYSRQKAKAFLDLLTSGKQSDGSTSDEPTPQQQELIDELSERFGYSKEEALRPATRRRQGRIPPVLAACIRAMHAA